MRIAVGLNDDSYEALIMRVASQMRYGKKDEELGKEDQLFASFDTDDQFDKTRFISPSKDEIKKLLGRKYIRRLTLMKPFVDVMKYKTSSKSVSICPISCSTKFWKSIYNGSRNVSNLLKSLREIGLLLCVDSHYQFNGYSSNFNSSKRYAWNKTVERELLELFKECDIRYPRESNNLSCVISIVERFAKAGKDELDEKKYKEYMRDFKIKITSQTRLPLKEDYIIKGLTEVYPQYIQMLRTIREDNSEMDSSDWDNAYPTLKYNKDGDCISIGLRKSNQYCNLKVHEIAWETLTEAERKRTRNEVIRQKFGGVHENDVKSSIYRITYLLNHGVWLDRSIDLYPKMAGFEFPNADARNTFKSPLAMKLYFCPSVEKIISTSTFGYSETKVVFEEVDANSLLVKARDNMFKAIGKSYKSEIFLHESCIYTQVAHQIRMRGYKLIQIYDGFFTDRHLDEAQFDEIVKNCALEYYRKWKGHWYTS